MSNTAQQGLLAPQDAAVLKYLDMLQSATARMATSSGSCKAWCVTLVSGILALSYKVPLGTTEATHYAAALAFVPWSLFCMLDGYYLSLERDFRERFKHVVHHLNTGGLPMHELFVIAPLEDQGRRPARIARAIVSASILPYYLLLGVLIALAWIVLP